MTGGRRRATVKVEPKGPAKRGTRTLGQGGAGYLVAELIDSFVDMDKWQMGVLAIILAALFSWVQTTVEDYLGTGLLRDAPDVELADPAPDRGSVPPLVVVLLATFGVVVLALLLVRNL